jgi:hypothetical protein
MFPKKHVVNCETSRPQTFRRIFYNLKALHPASYLFIISSRSIPKLLGSIYKNGIEGACVSNFIMKTSHVNKVSMNGSFYDTAGLLSGIHINK